MLFTTPVLRHPPVGGPYLRIENSIKALAKIAELYIHCRVNLQSSSEGLFYRSLCHGLFLAPSVRSPGRMIRVWRRLKRLVSALQGRESHPPADTSTHDYNHVIEVADKIKADVIWLGYGNISYPLMRYIKEHSSYRVVLDTDSVWSRYVLRRIPFAADDLERSSIEREGRAKEEEEQLGTKIADVTTAVSEVDADYYRAIAEHPRHVHLFSNVIDADSYRAIPPEPVGLKHPCLYLAGTFFRQSAMEDAARWVIMNVLPIVRTDIPGIHLYNVGAGSDVTLADVDDCHVTSTGMLQSVLPYLCHADVAIVPLRYESGTRFKIMEAGICGRPVVSTRLGAEGIPLMHGKDILLADEPEAFARAIMTIIRDQEYGRRLGANLKQLILEKYSVDCLAAEGRRILTFVTNR